MRSVKLFIVLVLICIPSIVYAEPKVIKLPNGLHLKQTEILNSSYKDYALADENMEMIEPQLSVRYADWYGDYVYGWAARLENDPEGFGFDSYSFAYKKGESEIKLYESSFSLRDFLKSIGAPEWDLNSPEYEAMFDSYEFQNKYLDK